MDRPCLKIIQDNCIVSLQNTFLIKLTPVSNFKNPSDSGILLLKENILELEKKNFELHQKNFDLQNKNDYYVEKVSKLFKNVCVNKIEE